MQRILCLIIGWLLLAVPTTSSQAYAAQSPQHQAGRQAAARKHDSVRKAGPAEGPFIHGRYVLSASIKKNGYHSHRPVVVVVDKGSHFTHVLQLQERNNNEEVVRVLTVSNAVGKRSKPTSNGRYVVAGKARYPVWVPPKAADPKQKPVPPYNKDHRNPLGVAAIYLNKWDLVLHGTNAPTSIRRNVSLGCIRHSNKDIARLYGMVRSGTPVYIVNRLGGKVIQRSDFVNQHISKT